MFKNIAFTCYAVTNMKKSRAFYEGVLGLTPNDDYPPKEDSAWIEYNIGPDTLALGCHPKMWKPSSDGASVALETTDFNGMAEKLKAAKVKFKIEPADFPSCRMMAFFDPDGNVLAIHQKK